MFKKLNTTWLLILLAVLGGIVAFNKLYQGNKDESTFRTQFVQIDSAAVNSIFIYPHTEKGKEIRLFKNGKHWDLQNDKIKTIADTQAVYSLLAQFADMKAVSLAGEDRSSWKDLQVMDTSGTRIKITTTGNKTYDMVVGKFGYNSSQRKGLTYIRHAEEEAVYVVEGYLAFSVNQGFDSWRNKTFLKGNINNWSSLTFTYPADSSFMLSKTNNQWNVNGEKSDSSKTITFLNELANMQSGGFVDSYSPATTPVFTLNINGNNQAAPITIHAYPSDSIQKYILHSSLNSDAYFSEAKSNLVNRIFAGKQRFIKQEEKADKK